MNENRAKTNKDCNARTKNEMDGVGTLVLLRELINQDIYAPTTCS
jgi:hypothetical protein